MSKVCNLAHAFAHILHFCVRILFVATIFDYDKNIKKFARVVFFNQNIVSKTRNLFLKFFNMSIEGSLLAQKY